MPDQTRCGALQEFDVRLQVLESQGHIRDLDAKEGSVDTDDDFRMTWVVDDSAQVRLDRIENELKQDGIIRFVLATDPDREGEAIAWHLTDILQVCFCLCITLLCRSPL